MKELADKVITTLNGLETNQRLKFMLLSIDGFNTSMIVQKTALYAKGDSGFTLEATKAEPYIDKVNYYTAMLSSTDTNNNALTSYRVTSSGITNFESLYNDVPTSGKTLLLKCYQYIRT